MWIYWETTVHYSVVYWAKANFDQFTKPWAPSNSWLHPQIFIVLKNNVIPVLSFDEKNWLAILCFFAYVLVRQVSPLRGVMNWWKPVLESLNTCYTMNVWKAVRVAGERIWYSFEPQFQRYGQWLMWSPLLIMPLTRKLCWAALIISTKFLLPQKWLICGPPASNVDSAHIPSRIFVL